MMDLGTHSGFHTWDPHPSPPSPIIQAFLMKVDRSMNESDLNSTLFPREGFVTVIDVRHLNEISSLINSPEARISGTCFDRD